MGATEGGPSPCINQVHESPRKHKHTSISSSGSGGIAAIASSLFSNCEHRHFFPHLLCRTTFSYVSSRDCKEERAAPERPDSCSRVDKLHATDCHPLSPLTSCYAPTTIHQQNARTHGTRCRRSRNFLFPDQEPGSSSKSSSSSSSSSGRITSRITLHVAIVQSGQAG